MSPGYFLLFSLEILYAAGQTVTFTVNSAAELTSVLKQTSNLPNVVVELHPSVSEFTLTEAVRVVNQLTLRGSNQTLWLEAGITVERTMLWEDMQLRTSAETQTAWAVEVRGRCDLLRVSIAHFHLPVFDVYGSLTLTQVTVHGSHSTVLRSHSHSASFRLISLTITDLKAPFLTAFPGYSINFTLTNSDFHSNSPRPQPLFLLPNLQNGTLTFHSCSFLNNTGVLVDIQGQGVNFTMSNSGIETNTGSILRGSLRNSYVRLENCSLSENEELAVDFSQFDSEFFLFNSVIKRHKSGGLFGFASDRLSASCQVTFQNSLFSDFNLTFDLPIPGVLLVTSCVGYLVNTTIINATMVSHRDYQIDSLIGATRGSLLISGLKVENSGSTGYLIGVNMGELHLTDFDIVNPYTGEGMYIGVSDGVMQVRNGSFTLGSYYDWGFKSLYNYDPIYFGALVCEVDIQDIRIQLSRINMGMAFALISSAFRIRKVTIENVTIGSAFIASYSKGDIAGLYMKNIEFNMHTFQPGIASDIRASDVSLINSHITHSSRGVMQISLNTKFTLTRATMLNVTAGAFIRSKQSIFSATNVTIHKCRFDLLLNNPIMSSITLNQLQVTETVAMLLFVSKSSISFRNCQFVDFSSDSSLLQAYTSQISFTNCTFRGVSVRIALGKITQNSELSFTTSLFSTLSCSGETGWTVSDSRLSMQFSEFLSFNIGLFQGVNSNVSISNSVFQDGGSPVASLRSNWAFGGVLGCVNCPIVYFQGVTVRNVSSKFGGAVSSKEVKAVGRLELVDSEFTHCSAVQGGAVYLLNTNFLISGCRFTNNTAGNIGGGVVANIQNNHSGLFQDCVFRGNSAKEGGGVEWSNAPVLLVNVSFRGNTADYGADVASYGVELASDLTTLTGQEASGQPMKLQFELLDHYGHRVTTTLFEPLILTETLDVHYRGNQAAMLTNGLFSYHDLTVYAVPGSHQTLTATLNYTQSPALRLSLVGSVPIHFRNCANGEISRPDRCDYCYPGNVSFSPEDTQCKFCPAFAFCAGGNQLSVNPGYWRESGTSLTILKCPLPGNCSGGPSRGCSPGFSGLLCSQCASEYSRIRVFDCQKCPHISVLAIQLTLVICEIGVFVLATLRFAVYRPSPFKLFLVKTILTHAQLVSAVSFFRMGYTEVISKYLVFIDYLATLLVVDLPSGCAGDMSPELTKAVLGSLLFPFLLFTYVCARLLAVPGHFKPLFILFTSALLFTPFIALEAALPLLFCESVDDSVRYVVTDMRVECWQGTHLQLVYALVLPSVILNVVAPVLMVVGLSLFRHEVFVTYFPMWISGYRWVYWELLMYLGKGFIISSIIASIPSNPLTQVLYCFSVLIPVSLLNVAAGKVAYLDPWFFAAYQGLYLLFALTVGFLSYFVVYTPGQYTLEYFISATVLTLNIAYLCPVLYGLVRGKGRDSVEMTTVPQATDTTSPELAPPPNSPSQLSVRIERRTQSAPKIHCKEKDTKRDLGT